MIDKIFEDNDLLDEKSYDTRIAEAANVQPDATYLAEDGYKKRLTEAVEAGSGGGYAKFDLREITIVNNTDNNITFSATIMNNNRIHFSSSSVKKGVTTTFKVVDSALANGKFAAALFVMRSVNGTINTISVEGLTVTLLSTGNGYYIASVPSSQKDLTMTIS